MPVLLQRASLAVMVEYREDSSIAAAERTQQAPEHRPTRRPLASGAATAARRAAGASARKIGHLNGAAIGYTCLFLVLGGYFAWICLEMSRHALGGAPLVAAIFGTEVVAVLALLLGLAIGRRR
jgi:hypothetical protein